MKTPLWKTAAATFLLVMGGVSSALAQEDADLMLSPSVLQANKDQSFTVDLILKNPSRQNIISVRSWLSYDPQALEAVGIDTSASLFNLAAPGEDAISASEGRIKMGRSNISGGVKDLEAKVATVQFRVRTPYATKTAIGFYDYQVSELGHTSVNIIDQGFPLNILGKEPAKLEIQLNPGASTAPSNTPPVVTPPAPSNGGIGGPQTVALLRPTNLKANTGSGYIDLKWEAPLDPARVGFNVYYGQTSGQYTRRRTVGNVNAFRLEGLTNNEAYYLAVTAYDALSRESDYSNEVGIIVNQPLSSTAPFETVFNQNYQNIPEQPQNGPLVGWLAFSAAGLSGTLLFGKKRQAKSISSEESSA